MAQANTPQDNYPFSTRDGKVIPLDILRSKSLIYQDFTNLASADVTIPAGVSVVIFLATESCVVVPETTEAILMSPDTPLLKAIMIPKDHVVVAAIAPGGAKVRGLTASGRIYVQAIEQWVGLGLDIQYKKG